MNARPKSTTHAERWDDIEHAAATWVVRRRGPLTEEENKELATWLRSDPRCREVYAEMCATENLFDLLTWNEDRPAAERQRRRSQATLGRRWLVPVGMAAAILGGLFLAASMRDYENGLPIATEVGGRRTLQLSDGSKVTLNTDSAVEIRYAAQQRSVRLTRGEAFFEVARDTNRPFRVFAGDVQVQAIGTAFNVRVRSATVEVLVSEGRVGIDMRSTMTAGGSDPGPVADAETPGNGRLVSAGEIAQVPTMAIATGNEPKILVSAVEPPQIQTTLAWQVGRLQFTATPLEEVVAEFNRYNRHKLVIGDPAIARRTFGGAFAANGHESLVRTLEEFFGIVAERRGDQTILRPSDSRVAR